MQPTPGQYGMQPGMTAMANGPPSGGMMRPPGPPGPMGAPPGMPGMPGAPGYGAQQMASSMQQMSLGGPPGPPGGMSGPPPPPAGLSGPGSGGPRPPGSFGAAPRPMPMGPPSGGAQGGFSRGPPAAGGPPGPPGAPMPGAMPGGMRPPTAGMPGGPRPTGAPQANGGPPPAMQQPQPGMQPTQPMQQPQAMPQQMLGGMPGAAPGPMAPGMRPPGAPGAIGGPPGPAGMAPPGPGSAGPMPGGARPAMPGFMPPGPPGGPRPMGPGGMPAPGGPPGPASGGPPVPGGPGGFGAPPMPGMMQQMQAAGPGGMPPGPPGMSAPPGPPGMMRPPGPPGGFGPPGPGMQGPPPPGMPGAAGPPSRQAMTSGRIDPTQIPRVVQPNQETQVFETRVNGAHVHPPSSLSRFVVRDTGNASPRLLRSTLNVVPVSADMLNNSGMQFALSVQPLGLPDPEDDAVVVVDLGELGPVRCGRCKAYMNPYMRWTDGGKTYVCNFCGQANPCPDVYFNYLGPDNRRRDVYERAELSRGTYEIVATKEYMVRAAQPVIHVFCIDVSAPAIASGATAATCQCIEQVLDSIQGGDNALVGVVTYDSSVHFYNVSKGQAVAQMLVMADVSDVYAPMSSNLLAKLTDAREQLAELLSSIPGMFAAAQGPECCSTAAIEACVELLKPTGGKVHAFVTGLPNAGSRALKMRDGNATLAEKEKQMGLLPQDNTYLTLAAQAADFNVCIDLFVLSQAYTDTATLSTLSHTTGGSLYHYCPFTPLMDQDQLLNDLKWNVSRPQGLEAILRVRCSQGLDVDGYVGSFYKPPNSPTDLYLPAIDCDKALVARLEIMEKMPANSEVYLQCALLYTTTDGARRVRVSTLALPVSDQMGAVFKGADLDSQLASLTRQVASNLPGGTFFSSKELILNRITAILAAYRKYCATSSSAVQLILPEALKLLPLYSLALHKSNMLRPDVRADDRSSWLAGIVSASPQRTMGLLHPRLFAVHNLLKAGGMPPNGFLPDSLVLSSEVIDSGGVYLLDSGADLLLYVDQEAPEQIVQDLFGLPNVDALLRAQQPLPLVMHDNPGSKLLFELLTALRQNRCAFMRLRIAKKGDPFYPLFANMMVEDRSTAGMSYVEFLCHVHRQIQEKMS